MRVADSESWTDVTYDLEGLELVGRLGSFLFFVGLIMLKADKLVGLTSVKNSLRYWSY